jgi:hypothetical protein
MDRMLFAIPASSALMRQTHEVVHRDPSTPFEVMREEVVRTGMLYVDSVVDGFVVSFMRNGEASAITQALLRNLSFIIKTVCRSAIHQAAMHAEAKELEAITRFLEARVVTTVRDGQKRGLIIYPLDEPQREKLSRAIVAGSEGQAREQRRAYVSALRSVLDEAVAHHYDDAFAALNLGFLARTAVAVGRAAIHGAGRTAVRLSVAQDSEEDLRALSRLLQAHLVPASMCRPA